jgi:hypothetical protein
MLSLAPAAHHDLAAPTVGVPTARAALPEAVTADLLSAKLDALGRFLLATHRHEARPDPEQPWLPRRDASCPACDESRAALGAEPAS